MSDFKKLNGYNVKDDRIGDLDLLDTTDKSSVVNSINSLNTVIGDLDNLETSNKTSVVNSINSLKTDINTALLDKQTILSEMVVFGDSWSDPTVTDAIWTNLIEDELGLNVHNYALSGSYLSASDTTSLETQVSTFNSDTTVNKSLVKYIVILGGINDYRGSILFNTLSNKIGEEIELLKTYCPQAKILYVSNCQFYYDETQANYWCGVHEDLRADEKITTLNLFGTLGREMYNTDNYFHLTQTGQKFMLSNIISALTGGDIIYFEDSIIVTNTDGVMKYSTQRIKNMILLNIQITPSVSQTTYSFDVPEGLYFNYYPNRFGVVGRAKEIGIIDINYNHINFDFEDALTNDLKYTFCLTLPINHT